jgi:hypothetical protein
MQQLGKFVKTKRTSFMWHFFFTYVIQNAPQAHVKFSSGSGQSPVTGSCEQHNKPSASIKVREVPDHLINY